MIVITEFSHQLEHWPSEKMTDEPEQIVAPVREHNPTGDEEAFKRVRRSHHHRRSRHHRSCSLHHSCSHRHSYCHHRNCYHRRSRRQSRSCCRSCQTLARRTDQPLGTPTGSAAYQCCSSTHDPKQGQYPAAIQAARGYGTCQGVALRMQQVKRSTDKQARQNSPEGKMLLRNSSYRCFSMPLSPPN